MSTTDSIIPRNLIEGANNNSFFDRGSGLEREAQSESASFETCDELNHLLPVEGPMSTRCILMSIRKEWWQEIAAGRKVLEFRTRFPEGFRGKVYVYESGKDSRHAVVGSFRVDYVIDADKARASKHEDWEILDRINSDQLNDFFERKYHAAGSLYAIHVTDVIADGVPMSLEDFGALLDNPVVRAPQSWQYVNI